MATLWSTFDNALQQAIMTLSMKVEVSYASRYRFTKDDKELIKLLMKASFSQYPEVIEAWAKVSAHFNQRQLTYFSHHGVKLGAKAKPAAPPAQKLTSPRSGLAQKDTQPSEPGKGDNRAKKKIVYRGQEKWV